ncbi:MAG: hypothetical protein ACOC9B_03600 [Chloroflexota bacterium]
MKNTPWSKWQIRLGLALIVLSVAWYFVHYLIFGDVHHIFIYLIGDIAFVFIEVLLVSLIIHQLLSARERRRRLEKLNMVIGAFFSEVGFGLLRHLSDWDPNLDSVRGQLQVNSLWTEERFEEVDNLLDKYDYQVDPQRMELVVLKDYIAERREFLLRLLENPNLLEHESFTNLLMAVFHMAEEMIARRDLADLPASDREHIAGDLNRVYGQLVNAWLDYMRYLRSNYPYLFSLAVRTNPFDESASPLVTS